ncbi:MAG: PQQ-binding-like beta-propeller repeat protein [Verrucomicrobiota bacterium]
MNPIPLPSVWERLSNPFLRSAFSTTLALVLLAPLGAAAAPGDISWRRENSGSSWETPAVDAVGRIYALRIPAGSAPAALESLDAEGTQRWSVTLSARSHLPPVLDPKGNVMLARTNGAVRSLNPDGETLWLATLRMTSVTGLALDADGLFHVAGSDSTGAPVYEVLRPDGSIVSRGVFAGSGTTTPFAFPERPPQIGSDGTTVYQGLGGGFGPSGTQGGISNTVAFYLPKASGLSALGPADILIVPESDGLSIRSADGGEASRWSGAGISSSPILTPAGQICFGTVSNRLETVALDGSELWSMDAGAVIQSTPVCLENGTIIAATLAGRLFAVNSEGLLLWERILDGPVTAHLNVLPDGRIVAGDDAGTLWCVETGSHLAGTGWPKWQSDPGNGGRNRSPRMALAAPTQVRLDDEGALLISWSSVPGARKYEVWKDTRPEFDTATLFRPSVVGNTSDSTMTAGVPVYYRIRALGPDSAGPFSDIAGITPKKLLWNRSLGSQILGLARLKDATLVATVITESQGQLIALLPNGTERWRHPLPTLPRQGPVVAEDGSFWISTAGALRQYHPDGSPGLVVLPGSAEGNGSMGAMALGQEGTLYVMGQNAGVQRLLAVHPTTGQIRGDTSGSAGDSDPPPLIVGRDGSILVLHEHFLACHQPGTQLRWTLGAQPSAAAVLSGGDYMVGTPRGLMRITPAGKVLWTNSAVRTDWAYLGRPSMTVDRNDVTYAWSVGRLFAVAPTGETLYATDRISFDLTPTPTFLPRQGGVYVLGGLGVLEVDSSGSTVRRRSLPTLGSVLDGLVVDSDSGGTLYLGSFQGSVAALNLDVGADTAAPWPLPHHDVSNSSSAVLPLSQAPDSIAASGTPWVGGNRVVWKPSGALVSHEIYRATDDDFSKAVRIGSSSASANHFDDTSATPGQEYHYWVIASNSVGSSDPNEPASVVGQAPVVRARLSLPGLDVLPTPIPVVRPDQTVVAATQTGLIVAADLDGSALWTNRVPAKTASQILEMMATADGRVLFRANTGLFEVTPEGSGPKRLGAPGNVLLLGADNHLRTREGTGFLLRDATGSVVGSAVPHDGFDGLGAVRSDGVMFVGTSTGRIKSLDAALNPGWEYVAPPDNPVTLGLPSSAAVGLDGSLYVAPGDRTLVSLDLAGRARWTQSLEPATWILAPPALGAGDATLLVSSLQRNFNRRLASFDANSGEELWRFEWTPGVNQLTASSPAVLSDRTVLYAAGNFLLALDSESGELRWGFESTGTVGAPLVSGDGSILFTAGGELVILRGTSPPAFSGWPMARHDARGTGGQGTGGGRDLAVTQTPSGIVRLTSEDGRPFLPLVSEDLLEWRPATGVFDTEANPPGEPRTVFAPNLPGISRFFRAVAP